MMAYACRKITRALPPSRHSAFPRCRPASGTSTIGISVPAEPKGVSRYNFEFECEMHNRSLSTVWCSLTTISISIISTLLFYLIEIFHLSMIGSISRMHFSRYLWYSECDAVCSSGLLNYAPVLSGTVKTHGHRY
jgi:hypothetical protein